MFCKEKWFPAFAGMTLVQSFLRVVCLRHGRNNYTVIVALHADSSRRAAITKPDNNFLRIAILSFTGGVFWLQWQETLPDLFWAPLCVATLLAAWLLRRQARMGARLARGVLIVAACAGLGVAWSGWMASTRLAEALPPAWEGRDIEILGVVSGLPTPTERGMRFEFDVKKFLTPEAVVPQHISLSWYLERERNSGQAVPPPELRPGQSWQLNVRLRRPHGTANPHGFDFEAWALERNIRATGYVRAGANNAKRADTAQGFDYRIDELRLAIRERFNAVLGDDPYRGVLIALAIGDQNAIPREQWKIFWRTGVGHLMSISGLHITMVASLFYALTFFLWSRARVLALRLPAQKAAAIAGAVAALGYSLIAGFSVPTQRTFFMLAVVALALWTGRIASASRVLCWALFVVLLMDPWAVLAPGFWLSFGAVAMIFYVTACRTGRPTFMGSALATQLAVTLGLLPMLLALFQEVSLVSPLANAFAIPLVSLVVVPATLIAAVVPIDALMHLAHWLMALCMVPLEWLAALPAAVWENHAPAPWTVALAMLGCAWLLVPRGIPARWLGVVWMLPMFMVLPQRPQPGELRMTVLDVGQGLAVVLQTARHALVYDTGPKWNPDSDSGSRIVVPFLRGEGIRRLNGLIVTHQDDDHSGGAISILDARDTGWLMSSLADDNEILEHATDKRRCVAGNTWEWDGVRFAVLHPVAENYAEAARKVNDRGCVLKVEAAGFTTLLTADIEKRSEAELLARNAAGLKSDVLVVPHHGSKTSSTPRFVAAISPQVAIFTVGYRNRFRHPHPDVLARYRDAQIKLMRSDEAGAITLHFSNAGISMRSERKIRKRYWMDTPRGDSALE
jgi:competence protein ComEC